MQTLPDNILRFIKANHVLSVATWDGKNAQSLWAASCFYAFDDAQNRLLILSASSTQHGTNMRQNPSVTGTISGQPVQWQDICGLQFSATARWLENVPEQTLARAIYNQRHPLARLKPSEIWQLQLTRLKFTDNRVSFGQKTELMLAEPLESPMPTSAPA